MDSERSREIRLVIRFHSDVQFMRIICRDGRNWTWKLSTNSNGHNLWLGCMCEAHDIPRHSKMINEGFWQIQMVKTFYSNLRFRRIIYRALEIEHESSRQIQIAITFDSGVCVWSSWYIETLKNENGSSREIQMVITFNSEVRLWRIIHRDARNWTTEALEIFKGS